MDTQPPKMRRPIDGLMDELNVLMAVETLEYHDKNYLAGSNKSRSEERTRSLQRCMDRAITIYKQLQELARPEPQTANVQTPVLAGRTSVKPSADMVTNRGDGRWIKLTDRKPPYGKLVYTRSPGGTVGAYTLYELGWNSWVSTDNEEIAEWYEFFTWDTPVADPAGRTE
ncbi:hypothetical protein [Spirosoma sp.]|uniref:hypothetical protein n=1 Tax=Spirosoma sp. TaxID=1899569 RepID=UPI00263014E9|nr:hypothetical protein [Spirosoma sp.]MCX6217629.1 hypothetical protein [Spirosoma sp.]